MSPDKLIGAPNAVSAVPQMWRDTLKLFEELLKKLPDGPLGALIKICIVLEILFGLFGLVAQIIHEHAQFWGCVVVMVVLFLFISFLITRRPGTDTALAEAQMDRAQRIAPPVIPKAGAAGA